MRVKGGYILQPRSIDESDIMSCPPYVREIWLYLIRNANSADIKHKGYAIKRGQLFRSYQDIRDALSWKVGYRTERYNENQTKMAMKFLRDTGRVTTLKQLGGVLITICNYDIYQSPKSYDTTNDTTNEDTQVKPSSNQPLPDNNKNDKNDKNNIIQTSSNDEVQKVEDDFEELPEEKLVKKPRAPRKKKESDKESLFKKARTIFEARFQRETKEPYYWQAKDSGNMTSLLNAIKHSRSEKGMSIAEDDMTSALSMFLATAIKDEWIKKNLSVSILYSKYNEIVARAKQNEQQRKKEAEYGEK